MGRLSADSTNVTCIVNGLAPETFTVSRYRGTDEISAPYSFSIEVVSKNGEISAGSIVGQSATLFIMRNDIYTPYSGIVTQFAFIGNNSKYSSYRLNLSARLWTLSLSRRSKVFQNISPLAVVTRVLDDNTLGSYYQVSCQNSYGEQEFIMQYNETDLNFIRRLMQDAGIWFFFREPAVDASALVRTGIEQLVITDAPSSFGIIEMPDPIHYHPRVGMERGIDDDGKETICELCFEKQMTAREVTLRNYNYRTPAIDLSSVEAVDGGSCGEINDFGGNAKNPEPLTAKARIRANQLATGLSAVSGNSNGKAFRAGCTFSLFNTPHPDIESTLLLKKVNHEGAMLTDAPLFQRRKDSHSYGNTFSAIATSRLETFMPFHELHYPKVDGIVSAKVESLGGPYAYLDETGRYKIRLPFDTAEAPEAAASKFIRFSQHYSGSNYGIHFPAHKDTEMLIGYINGDPDKPIGLGTVPNENTRSPVTSVNKHQSIIRTAGNNQIVLDDMDQRQKILLSTNANNQMTFDDDLKTITMKTTNDNKIVLDDRNKVVSINAAENTVTISYNDSGSKITIVTKDGHCFSLDDEHKAIEIQTSGGHIVTLDDQNEKLELTDAGGVNSVILDKNNGIFLATTANLEIRADGSITIQSGGNVAIESDSDVSLQGNNITVSARSNTEIEAGGNATVSGSMNAGLTGNAQVTVSGGIVNIN